MTQDQFVSLCNMKPFVPFTIRFTSGRKIRIECEGKLTYWGSMAAALQRGPFQNPEWLDVTHIESVKWDKVIYPDVPTWGGGNGPG